MRRRPYSTEARTVASNPAHIPTEMPGLMFPLMSSFMKSGVLNSETLRLLLAMARFARSTACNRGGGGATSTRTQAPDEGDTRHSLGRETTAERMSRVDDQRTTDLSDDH